MIYLILAASTVWHMVSLFKPAFAVFDETYYTMTGALIPVHPPLSQILLQAVTGDSVIPGRILAVLFGAVGIYAFWWLLKRYMPSRWASLGAGMLAFEPLTFYQSQTAMLDIFAVSFTIVAVALYVYGRVRLAGVSTGIALLMKASGVYALFVIGLDILFKRLKGWRSLVNIALIAQAIFFIGVFAITRINPISYTLAMFRDTFELTGLANPASSNPLTWFYSYNRLNYYYGWDAGLSLVLWFGAAAIVAYLGWQTYNGDALARLGLSWFIGTYGVICLAYLLTGRTTYSYYLVSTVPALIIGVVLAARQLSERLRPRYAVAIPVLLPIIWVGDFLFI